MEPSSKSITQLLVEWRNGDMTALDKLTPLVYEEMRRLANHYMRRERQGHTLQTSALVNEAYIRLVDHKNMRWQIAHTFLPWPLKRCVAFWWTTRAVATTPSGAARLRR